MRTWFTADLHFGHQRIIELCNRPFDSVGEMNEALVHNWNKVIEDGDSVYIVGDLCMGQFAESIKYVHRLKGRKILVPGNHDRVHPVYPCKPHKRAEFRKMYEDAGLVIAPLMIAFASLRICHFPYEGDSHGEDRYVDQRPTDDGALLIHGHVHDQWRERGRQYNVGVDVHDYSPVPLERVLEWAVSSRPWADE